MANTYAEHVLLQGQDDAILKELLEVNDAIGADNTLANKYVCLIGEAYYDAETGDEKELADAFMDAHGLLFELEEELTAILNPDNTHIAVGFAYNQN